MATTKIKLNNIEKAIEYIGQSKIIIVVDDFL